MEPVTYHLPSSDGANEATIVDMGGAGLRECIEFAARNFNWRFIMLPLLDETEILHFEDITDDDIQDASFENVFDDVLGAGTVRRIMTHAMIIALVTGPDGEHVAEFVEARGVPSDDTRDIASGDIVYTPESMVYGEDEEDEDSDDDGDADAGDDDDAGSDDDAGDDDAGDDDDNADVLDEEFPISDEGEEKPVADT